MRTMIHLTRALALLGFLIIHPLWVACDDGDTPTKDAAVVVKETAVKRDSSKLDMGSDTTVAPDQGVDSRVITETNIGKGCQKNSDCYPDAPDCLSATSQEKPGFCSRACISDDPNTPLVSEDDCPAGYLCTVFNFSGVDYPYCLQECSPSLTDNPCPPTGKRTCHPLSRQYTDSDKMICWYRACQDGVDCPVQSDIPCTSDGVCTAWESDAFCDLDDNLCARPGNCTPGGLCGPHTLGAATAAVGDPCDSDFDCPGAGSCFMEQVGEGPGVAYRNGYCVTTGCFAAKYVSEFACPSGSACNTLYYSGICFKTCDLADADGCRGYEGDRGGDYECYAWQNLVTDIGPVSPEPICMTAPYQDCYQDSESLDCSSLGDENGNPTNMTCRDRFTGAETVDTDPNGICMDDTSSGPFQTTDAGLPDSVAGDSSAADAGIPDAASGDI